MMWTQTTRPTDSREIPRLRRGYANKRDNGADDDDAISDSGDEDDDADVLSHK